MLQVDSREDARVQGPVVQAAQATAAAASNNLGSREERRGERLQRRQLGRWAADEVAALIEGVQVHGTQWSVIYEAYVLAGRINPGRTQV